MSKKIDNHNAGQTSKRFVLFIVIILNCLITATCQIFTTREISELHTINVLQIRTTVIENLDNDKLNNWILMEGNASLIAQEGIRNNALIEQVRGISNIAKVIQKGHNNWIGFEYAGKKECGVYQAGSRNYTEILQFGNQNKLQGFQYGNGNEMNIIQQGALGSFIDRTNCVNKSIVSQTVYGNYVTVIQSFY